jgi:hypothetical protein
MGNLQNCVSVNGRHFCWDNSAKKLVEVSISPLPGPTIVDDTCEEAMRLIAIKRFGLVEAKNAN